MTIYLLFVGMGLMTLTIFSAATAPHSNRAYAALAATTQHAVASQTEFGRGATPLGSLDQPVADLSCGDTGSEELHGPQP